MKLSAVAASFGALYLMPSGANAAVIEGTTGPITIGTDNTGLAADWDIDGDGNRDFILWENNNLGPTSLFVNLASSNSVVATYPQVAGPAPNGRGIVHISGTISGSGTVAPLATSFYVGPTLAAGYQFNRIRSQFRTVMYSRSSIGTNKAGTGFADGENLLGLQFLIAGAEHFAWANINVDLAQGDVTITEWFYEDEPGAAIHVGDRGGNATSIPEPGTAALTLLGLGAAGLAAWRHRKKAEKRKAEA